MSVKCTGRKQRLEHFAAGGGKKCCDPYTRLQRIVILPVFPRVPGAAHWHASKLASKLKKCFQALWEARDQEVGASLGLRNDLT